MHIKLTSEVITQHIPTKTDTLQKVIGSMQVKIDSLEKIVLKTEIGTGFFSDIISLQLGVFALLVGAAGFFSWKWLQYKLDKIETDSKEHTNTEVKTIKDDLTKRFDLLSDEILSTAYDVQRSMYFHTRNNEIKSTAFQWSLSAFCTLNILNPEDKFMLEHWARISMDLLSTLNVGELEEVKDNEKLEAYTKMVLSLEDPELNEIFKDFKKDLYHILYAKQQPPANLMQDIEEAVVES